MADLAGIPLAWMIGSMLASTAAAVAGFPIAFSHRFRTAMVAILGIMLGSSFSPEMAAQMGRWVYSLAGLALYTVVSTAVAFVYFRCVARYDPVTSYFCAVPGGINEMTMVGGALGGDERAISLTHGSRILLAVATIPIWFRLFEDYDPAPRAVGPGLGEVDAMGLVVLAACGLVGFLLAQRLRLPAAAILGPMMLSAAVHLAGITDATPPAELIAAAQVVAGSAIGARFAGTRAIAVARIAWIAAGATIIMVAVTLAFALALRFATDLSLPGLVLAYAPGGLAEMSLVALALGIEAAFVATHHVARIAMVVLVAPTVFRRLPARWRAPLPASPPQPVKQQAAD